jgi:zinc/manganese transport system ATP-binding protein
MHDECIVFNNLTLGYDRHPAVHHLNGVIRRGSLTAVVGPNGSGKSTLMKGISGLLKPLEGTCVVTSGNRLTYLPQLSGLDRSFPARVIDLVSLGLWPRRGLLGFHNQQDRQDVAAALRVLGLEGLAQRSIDTLSGGQLQRVLFARVLVQNTNLILLDEPFSAVDGRTTQDLIGLIKHWHDEKRTILVVVHDLDLVRQYFPETLLLARELIAWGKTCATLTPENLQCAQQFHEAWDETAPWCMPATRAHDRRTRYVYTRYDVAKAQRTESVGRREAT